MSGSKLLLSLPDLSPGAAARAAGSATNAARAARPRDFMSADLGTNGERERGPAAVSLSPWGRTDIDPGALIRGTGRARTLGSSARQRNLPRTVSAFSDAARISVRRKLAPGPWRAPITERQGTRFAHRNCPSPAVSPRHASPMIHPGGGL